MLVCSGQTLKTSQRIQLDQQVKKINLPLLILFFFFSCSLYFIYFTLNPLFFFGFSLFFVFFTMIIAQTALRQP